MPDDNDSLPPSPAPPRRPLYQSTLLPERRRRRLPVWVAVPALLLGLGAVLYFLLAAPHRRRVINTVGQIAFASDAGSPGTPHIFLSGADGTNPHRLTTQAGPETAPAWSPDGTQVAFLAPGAGGANQVWVADADGQNLQAVTRTSGDKAQPQFSPSDPNLVAFLSGGALSVADVGSGSASRLLPSAPDRAASQDPDAVRALPANVTITSYNWIAAHDGAAQGIAAAEDAGGAGVQALLLLPALSGTPTDANAQGGPLAAADTLSVAASPDGAHLAVAMLNVRGVPKGQKVSALVLLGPDGQPAGQTPLVVVARADTGPQNPAFSPDGTQVLFELWNAPDLAHRVTAGLFVVGAGGGVAPRPVFQGNASGAQWTADGSALLFIVRRKNGGHDLCMVHADGTGFLRLSDGVADVSGASVSPQRAA